MEHNDTDVGLNPNMYYLFQIPYPLETKGDLIDPLVSRNYALETEKKYREEIKKVFDVHRELFEVLDDE
jgi:hypothetical protein